MKKWLLFFLILLPCMAFAKTRPIIVLDAGHGGKDQGARVKNMEEKQLCLRTAYLTKKHLEELGYRVTMTRARDIFLPLTTRVNLANRRSSSLFVSIHYNSASSKEAKGIEVYYYGKGLPSRKEQSRRLAASILRQMVKKTDAKSRGIKHGNFQVIRETQMPAVLVEAGFITNVEERGKIATQTYLDQLAIGIARGIDLYVK